MKKLLFVFSLCMMMGSVAFSQDDTYYTGDEATVTVKAQEAPPALPEYTQPPCPEDGYIWTPGFWGWGADAGYYWVPGVWVAPPSAGLLWTPAYWGFYHGYYGFHPGYWGEHIGYYGGINYGFGYYGTGFYGGRWEGGHFRYNTAVWHVNPRIHNVYESREGVREVTVHASFNGPGGIRYRPAVTEEHAMHERHVAPTREQVSHHEAASHDRGQYAHTNHGQPAYHSTNRPGGQHYDAGAHQVQVHHEQPVHHVTPVRHAEPVHHVTPVHHAEPARGGGEHGGGEHGGGRR